MWQTQKALGAYMENLTGRNIKGYQLLERIGTGGFGAVYKANQSTIGREVAIKIILPHFANHPDFIRRFETEAQLVARLEHLHIVPLFDYWRDPTGAYLVMRWLRGGSLREALETKAFEVEAAALLLDQIAAALSVAHRNHVIHRDIKPGNILLDEDGNAYLADFGIAKDASSPGITEVDAIVGSPDYLAPEQASGEEITPRTDIYSLGVVLYELLVGEHPFPNLNTVERLYKHLSEPLPEVLTLSEEISDEVNAVIQKATAKNPSHRYPDAMAMAAAFRDAIKLRQPESLVESLTQREQEILSRIIAGMSNQQIASELVITLGTVKWYVNQIFRKLNVRSRVQAIVRARELNLITSGSGTAVLATIPTEDFNPENPYKGLQAFQAADNQDFFGREKLVQKLVARLSEASKYGRFLAVIGPSGSGKSSLVKAGLIPALWRGDLKGSEKWFIVEMLPGSHPLDELEIALTRIATRPSADLGEQLARDKRGLVRASQLILPEDKSEIVLVIDQFEELFTLVEDEPQRRHFLELLYAAVTEARSRVRVIITLRADFYDRPLHYPDFGELMHARIETVLPLSAEGLEQAIARPAERLGAVFEPGLVSTIVGDVHYQPGALPLLQYALTELFERRQGRLLTHEAYREIGGTVGALAKRAEDIYNELPEQARQLTRQMFLRLVTLGEGTEDTRRRTPRSELLALASDADVMDEVIDIFAAYRLLSLDNDPGTRTPTVEVAHEAILREWERLRLWIVDNREEIKMQQQLAHSTEEWLNAKKDTSFLASGLRLEQFEKWAKETTQALTSDERAYIEASLAERARQTHLETERQQHEVKLERRSRNFLLGLVAVLLLATIGAFGLTSAAVNQSNIAQVERLRAEQQSRIAQARELVGYATNALNSDAELSTLLALQAVKTTYNVDGSTLPEAETMLHQAVQRLNPPLRLPAAPYESGATCCLSMTSSGTRVAYISESMFAGRNGETAIANVSTGDVLYTISGHLFGSPYFVDRVMTWSVTENGSFALQYWDISSEQRPEQIASFIPQVSAAEIGGIGWVDVSSDSRYVAAQILGVNRLFDLASGEEITALVNLPRGDTFAQFSPDSQRLVNINPDGTLSILETATWVQIAAISPRGTRVNYFKFSPSGAELILANADNTISVWETDAFTELYTVSPTIPTDRMALSQDGSLLAAASISGSVVIWDTATQQEMMNLSIGGEVSEITFDANGTRLVSYHTSGHLQIWNLVPGQEYLTMVNDPLLDDGPSELAYSPDGQHLVVGSMSATPTVWNALTGQQVYSLSGHAARVLSVAWSPDGTMIATGGEDTHVMLWDAATGESALTLSGHEGSVYSLAFSPDSTRIATSGYDQTVRIWDTATGELLLILEQPAWSKGVAWSPDGTRIAAGTDQVGVEGFVRVWDSITGEMQLNIPVGNTRTGRVVFSPDGAHLLVGLQEAHSALVMDAQTGDTLLTLSGHANNVPGVAYSPDGKRIATASLDGTTRLWDAVTGQELLILYNSDNVGRVEFSPDGKYLATLDQAGISRVYVLSVVDLIALAESRLTRWWTAEECQRYLHTETCPEAQMMK
jgi:WD40 repeat protein/serine/threonine protein kinase